MQAPRPVSPSFDQRVGKQQQQQQQQQQQGGCCTATLLARFPCSRRLPLATYSGPLNSMASTLSVFQTATCQPFLPDALQKVQLHWAAMA